MLRQDLLLQPPGAGDANGSGRGKKQDQARDPRIPVEGRPELIEIANPLDGGSFDESDGHALTYIGQQLGEFVAQHGVVVDPEASMQQPQAALKRR